MVGQGAPAALVNGTQNVDAQSSNVPFVNTSGPSFDRLNGSRSARLNVVELSADYRTGKGEQRRIVLTDDISLALNTQTSIVVRSTPQEARIELISGEATIATNRTSSNPLVVDATDGRMVVARARFNALCEEGVVRVTCIEGEVDVEWRKQAVRLQPRQQVSYSPEGLGVSVSVDPTAATAWQERLLIFRDRPLAEVIDEVNRYRPGRIIVTNSELARRLVNGTFHLDRLDDVVAQVRQLFGARVTSLPGGVVLLELNRKSSIACGACEISITQNFDADCAPSASVDLGPFS